MSGFESRYLTLADRVCTLVAHEHPSVMPDGDYYQSSVARLYRKAFEQLCEPRRDADDRTQALRLALRNEVVKRGDLPFATARRIAHVVDGAAVTPLGFRADEVNRAVDRVLQTSGLPSRDRELVRSAARDLVHDLRYGRPTRDGDACHALFERYIHRCYDASIRERVLQVDPLPAGVDRADLSRRLQESDPEVNRAVTSLAGQADRKGTVGSLRLPNRRKRAAVEPSENLL